MARYAAALLGVAAGAGLGATIAIAYAHGAAGSYDLLPLAAFAGAGLAVVLAYALGATAAGGRNPAALVSYSENSKIPLPGFMIRLNAPVIARAEMRLNAATPEAERADLAALPGHLDRIDGWIGDGVIGGSEPNAADLQIASTLRLLLTLEDLRPQIEPRPAGALALRLFPQADGHMPAGSLPV